MSFVNTAFIAVVCIQCAVCGSDVMVQLNVNRPFNDLNEKFISFAIKPEDLYRALDGPHRRTMTRMATMLGDSHIKFIGDYYFASKSGAKMRNPTEIIWRGFNRWTRAVNWTMIIPVPYEPNTWDPMHTLKILNSSYMNGISDCIWQLGTDFGSSRAHDYVTELRTLNLMVDSFRPFVDDWQIMGADISAGSSSEETRKYIEMSKDLNAAFGWTQPAELMPSNSLNSYIYEGDPALRMLLSKKVPVWLSLPQKTKNKKSKPNSSKISENTVTSGLRWAQTLGDAASTGFDVIFKKITISDLERPSFSFYVTALFKKVMGSRVFPARPLNTFTRRNKLYTHCANTVSGGIAFMVVNIEESPIHISVRSISKFTGTEVWQYTLTYQNDAVLLNNNKLALNSSLVPQIKTRNSILPVQLSTPGQSVSFWVLPTVNLDHCQYTEVEADEGGTAEKGKSVPQKRYSSSDRLLQKLIQETSVPSNALSRAIINRSRRYATFASRPKRFILENKNDKVNLFDQIFQPMTLKEQLKVKRESNIKEPYNAAIEWIKNLIENPLKPEMPLLRRGTRSADNYFGPFFASKDGKKITFTKKITEIKKPEKKMKHLFNLEEFDEEKFFKKIEDQIEPEYTRLPEGDVHLKHITNADGEEIEDYKEEKKGIIQKSPLMLDTPKEIVSEMKPLRLLPTEFYEALPLNTFSSTAQKLGFGATLNSLLFPEPFSKKITKNSIKLKGKYGDEQPSVSISEVEEIGRSKFHKSSQIAEDFLRTQKELSKSFLNDNDNENKKDSEEVTERDVNHLEPDSKPHSQKPKYVDFFAETYDNYFGDNDEIEQIKPTELVDNEKSKAELEDVPWWDPSSLRKKRSTHKKLMHIPEETWISNMITKDDKLTPLGVTMSDHLSKYEYKVEGVTKPQKSNEEIISKKLMATVKKKVSNFLDIVTRHVSEWYNTLTKHIEVVVVEATTIDNNVN